VREKLVKSVFPALRIAASHQSHPLAEAPGHGHQATAPATSSDLAWFSLVVTAAGAFLVAVPPS